MLGHDASMTADNARHVVLWEGRTTEDGRRLLPNSVTWDDALPIMQETTSEDASGIYGMMTDFRREDDGSLTALCTPDIPEGTWLSAGFTWFEYDVMGEGDDQVVEFSSGKLQYAMLLDGRSIWDAAS